MPSIKTILSIVIILLIFFATSLQSVSAQSTDSATPTPTPTQEEQELDQKIRIAKKKLELAQAEQSTLATKPTPTSTPLTGEVTGASNLKMEVNFQTYKAARQVTDHIACDIRQNVPNAGTFVLYKQDAYLAWRNYKAMDAVLKQQLQDMEEEYDFWLSDRNTVLGVLKNKNLTDGGANTRSSDGIGVTTAISTALLGTSTAVRSLVDLLSIFRTNVEYSYSSVNISDNSLKSMVSDSLRRNSPGQECKQGVINKSINMFDPDTFYPLSNPNNQQTQTNNTLFAYVNNLSMRKRAAEVEVAVYDLIAADITKFNKDIETSENNITALEEKIFAKTAEERALTLSISKAKGSEKAALVINQSKLQQEISSLNARRDYNASKIISFRTAVSNLEKRLDFPYKLKISRLKQLNSEFAQFFAALNMRDSNTQVSPLMQYSKTETLDEILKSPAAYWLEIRSVEAGGNVRVQKNLLRYFYKPDITFSGGSIVEYSVSNREGNVVASNTEGTYNKYQKANKIGK